MVRVCVGHYYYGGVLCFLGCESCPVDSLLGCSFVMWVGVSYVFPLILKGGTECTEHFVSFKGGVEVRDLCGACDW